MIKPAPPVAGVDMSQGSAESGPKPGDAKKEQDDLARKYQAEYYPQNSGNKKVSETDL